MLKLKGKNFQPWADFILEVDKLTVIVGPSNKGKSSLFRALKGIMRNELPASFVREKHDPLELELEVNSHVIRAERKRKGSAKYEVDGKPYTSLGGKVPDVITDMKFGEVRLGDTVIDPIFAPQNKAQFLIDPDAYKPSDINAVLGAFASTEKLDKGKKEANLRITQKNSEARTYAEEVREALEREAVLQRLTVLSIPVKVRLSDLEQEIKQDELKYGWALMALKSQQRVLPLKKIVQSIELPDLEEAEARVQQVQQLELAAEATQYVRWLTKLNTSLNDVSDTWSEVVRLFKQSKGVSELIELLAHKDNNLTKLKDRMNAVVTEVEDGIEEAVSQSGSIKYLSHVLLLRERIEEKQDDLQEIQNALSVLDETVEDLRTEIAKQAAQAAQAEERKKLCPKCGKSMEHICG